MVNSVTRAITIGRGLGNRAKRVARRWIPRQHPHWSIGIYVGNSPFHLGAPADVANPVLTRHDLQDVRAHFVADPFMLRVDGTWYMFFEILNHDTGKGEISLATSDDGFTWTYRRVVLAEAFSLSYPYVFEWMNEYYMIPESRRAGSVRLYRASAFPEQWTCVGTLLERGFVDTSVFHYDGRWWLFAETNPRIRHDTLRLFHAPDLPGPWREHRKSPLVRQNPRMARPAGRVLVVGSRVIRFAQDCYPTYSTAVRAFEVTTLTPMEYDERECIASPILGPGDAPWNQSGMHHIDAHLLEEGRWIACVDGHGSS
ncbi:MAG: glucosamine inositolphosphorylceramide transferase family protein [Candidatus Methylomirabilaceae bacterium]